MVTSIFGTGRSHTIRGAFTTLNIIKPKTIFSKLCGHLYADVEESWILSQFTLRFLESYNSSCHKFMRSMQLTLFKQR